MLENGFQNYIKLSGLGDDITAAMIQHAQKVVVENIMQAATTGQTSCVVKSKGITPSFLAQLEEEGVSCLENDDTYTLFWEF